MCSCEKMTLKELCDKYNITYDSKHGKYCKEQLSKYCEFTQQGRNYTLVREYNENERLALSNSKFSDYIQDLLIKRLSVTPTKTIYSYAQLFEDMGMINKFYRSARSNVYRDKEFYEVPKFSYPLREDEEDESEYRIISHNLGRFFQNSSKLMKEIVVNSLNSGQRKRLFFWKATYIMYKKVDDDINIPIECTKEQAGKILDWENEALEIVGYKTKWFGKNRKAKKDFDDYVNTKIKQYYDCDFYTDAVDLTLAPNSLQKEAFKIDCKRLLNQNVQTKLLESKEMDDIIRSLNKQFVKEYIKTT